MESYEEFARRAQIMTEIHALPNAQAGEKMSGEISSSSSSDPVKQSASKNKEKEAMKKSLKRL